MGRLLTATAVLLLATSAGAHPEDFPRPSGIEDRVAFWTRVYSEVDSDAGILHDAKDPSIQYGTFYVPLSLSNRASDARIEAAKALYTRALRELASGKRTGLSDTEARVLALFPQGVSNGTLLAAAERIRFQRGQADKFRAGVIRSGAWRPYIEQALAGAGVPVELAALPHVESSYDPNAYSHAGAAGLWQFMRSTGRRFLQIDYVVDERFDPWKSSDAAGRFLAESYDITGSWPLAVTGYNHGPGGMARAADRLGTTNIVEIIERYDGKGFGFASKNFYSEFLAAFDVERDAERFFGPLERHRPVEYQVVVLDSFYTPTTLERVLGVEADLLRAHNLALRSSVWSGKKRIPKGYALRVPVNPSLPEAQVALASVPPADRYVGQTRDRTHTVRKGETVASIAKRFGLSQRELLAANGMKNGKGLRAGQTLRLPDGETGGRIPPAEPLAAAPPQHAAPVGPDGKYHVRLGDTAGAIARRLGVSEAELVAANGLSSGDHIRAGDVLTVPGRAPAQRARTYSVRKGDSIRSIAAKLGVDPADLIAANALRDGDRIRTGQVLRVPASGTAAAPATATYKVKKGDTLSSIARRFRVKPSALIAANSLSDRDEIRAGQVLRIP